MSAKLARAGFTPGIEQADLKEKGTWYRVRLQGYATRSAAVQAGDRLRTFGFIRDYWIVPSGQ